MEHKTIDAEEFKDLDEDFMPIYGKNPDKDSVLKILKERSKAYKDCETYEKATEILKKNNPKLLKWLQTKEVGNKVSGNPTNKKTNEDTLSKEVVEDEKNQRMVDEYLAER